MSSAFSFTERSSSMPFDIKTVAFLQDELSLFIFIVRFNFQTNFLLNILSFEDARDAT